MWKFVTLMTVVLIGHPLGAAADSTATSTAGGESSTRPFSFNPDPAADYFLVTEFRVSRLAIADTQDPVDSYLFTDSFGLMRRLSSHDAVGATIDFHLAEGEFAAAPSIRYRRWLTRQQSIELSAGYASGDKVLSGPIVEARYSPVPPLHVQVGVARYVERRYVYEPPVFVLREEKKQRWYGGVGCAGSIGAVAWGAQLVAAGLMLIFVARLAN
jgi:hypothetical protein